MRAATQHDCRGQQDGTHACTVKDVRVRREARRRARHARVHSFSDPQSRRPLTRPPFPEENQRPSVWSGRLDLNQRPLAPQGPPAAAQPPPDLPKPSESLGVQGDAPVQGSQGSTTIRRNFATNLLPPVEQLLTVRQVAQLLGVCRATVYKWAAIELLPHVRIVNVIRVRPRDLGAFIASRPPTS